MGLSSSPRPWGCFLERDLHACDYGVFPTPVGVFLAKKAGADIVAGLPHARGGVSGTVWYLHHDGESSPRPWGCFSWRAVFMMRDGVFPTPVGVFVR